MSDFQEQTHAGHIPFRPARKRLERILPLAAVLLLAVLAAGATYVSFRVSVRFYRKRQNGAYT